MNIYSVAEIARILNITPRAVQKKSQHECWVFEKRRGNGGGKIFPFATLPKDVQAAILAAQAKTEPSAVPALPTNLPTPDPSRLPLAYAKADLVRLYLAWQRKHGATVSQKQAFIDAYLGGAYPQVFAQVGAISWKTLERWKKRQLDAGSAVVLADKRGIAHRGKSSLTKEHIGIILGAVLNPNAPNISQAVRQIQKRCIASEIFEPSAATIRRFVNKYVAESFDEWTLFRQGQKAWNDKCAISVLRDWSLVEVGDIVIADGHTLNFETLNPETGKPKRMTLLLFFDGASNMPLGWEIMPTENTACISSAFRRACIMLGKFPKVIYLDNGRAFRAKFFSGCADFEQAGISGLYEGLGCKVIHAWPYHGQSKTVERFFGTMHDLEVFMPSYTGNSIATKPPRMMRGETLHRSLYNKMGCRPLTLTETHTAVAAWFDEYANRPSRSTHLKNHTPWEVFESGRGTGIDTARLDLLMLSKEIRTITKDGVSLFGRLFWHEALASRRHPVLVRYDEVLNPHSILIYDNNGEFICEARDRGYYGIASGIHPAAKYLSDTEQQAALESALQLKKSQERTTAANFKTMLESIVLPAAHERQVILEQEKQASLPKPAPQTKALSSAEIEEIEAAKIAALEKMNARPLYIPSYEKVWRDELERYHYLFCVQHENCVQLTKIDEDWKNGFEKRPEYKRNYARRYEQLRQLFAVQNKANR